MNLFEKFNILHKEDVKEWTKNIWVCVDFVWANSNSKWWVVKIWVPNEIVTELATDEKLAVLLIIDRKKFDELKNK